MIRLSQWKVTSLRKNGQEARSSAFFCHSQEVPGEHEAAGDAHHHRAAAQMCSKPGKGLPRTALGRSRARRGRRSLARTQRWEPAAHPQAVLFLPHKRGFAPGKYMKRIRSTVRCKSPAYPQSPAAFTACYLTGSSRGKTNRDVVALGAPLRHGRRGPPWAARCFRAATPWAGHDADPAMRRSARCR